MDRYEYRKGRLDEKSANPNPFEQFNSWLQLAIAEKILEPTAMTLSTISSDGRPHSRIVLLRGYDKSGFVFFSNYQSDKGSQISAVPYGALNFWWAPLERQIRIEGAIEMVPSAESDEYWGSRPLDSRIASAVSPQSKPIESREWLMERVDRAAKSHPSEIARPSHWGGYRVIPDYFEFWQGGEARLHDRLCYRIDANQWKMQRLAP